MTFVELLDGLVVTTDKDSLSFDRAVVLKHDKYEKMYSVTLRGIHDLISKWVRNASVFTSNTKIR